MIKFACHSKHTLCTYLESWLTVSGGPTLEAREQLRKRMEAPRPSSSEGGGARRVRVAHQPRHTIM